MSGIEEEWRPVVGYEGRYEVSDLGRVRSVDRVYFRSDGVRHTQKGRILKPWTGGYHLSLKLGDVTKSVHRLVAQAFIPNPDNLPDALHGPNGPHDNSVGNLRWGTHLENMRDKDRDGTNHQANKTHCPWGHEYVPENTEYPKKGGRNCRSCHRARSWARGRPERDFKDRADEVYKKLTGKDPERDIGHGRNL